MNRAGSPIKDFRALYYYIIVVRGASSRVATRIIPKAELAPIYALFRVGPVQPTIGSGAGAVENFS